MKLGFVTCDALTKYFPSAENPLLTHDDLAAANYLMARGVNVVPVLWGATPAYLHKNNIAALVMRSPWNYSKNEQQCARFIEWMLAIKAAGLPMVNDVELMGWNLDKRYLGHLADAGACVIPTSYIEQNDVVDFRQVFKTHGPFVIKPAIGAGALDLKRFIREDDVDSDAINALRRNRRFLLQPYANTIEELGEWSLVYFDGVYSHAVLKRPGPKQWLVQDELGGSVVSLSPPDAARHVANTAMSQLPEAYFIGTGATMTTPVYARVDLIALNQNFAVSELELVEPELFFLARHAHGHAPNNNAIELFSRALAKTLALTI